MKKIFVYYVLFSLFFIAANTECYAFNRDKVLFSAEKIDRVYLEGEVDKRVLNKFIPVRLTVKNLNDEAIFIPNKIFYKTLNDKTYKVPGSNIIFEKSKRHTIRRAFLWGVPVTILTIGFWTIPATCISIAHSTSSNGNLEDNIRKNGFSPHHVFNEQTYSTYVYVPKKHKKLKTIIIKDVSADNIDNFDLKSDILNQNL